MATGGEGFNNDRSIATMDHTGSCSEMLDSRMEYTTSIDPATCFPQIFSPSARYLGQNYSTGPKERQSSGGELMLSMLAGQSDMIHSESFVNPTMDSSVGLFDKSFNSDAIKLAVDSQFDQTFLSMFAPQEVASTTSSSAQHTISPPSPFISHQSMLSVDPFALPNNTSFNQGTFGGSNTSNKHMDERSFGQKYPIIEEGLSPRSVALDGDFSETNAAITTQAATAPRESMANREIQKVQITRALSDTSSNDDKASATQVVTRHCCPFPDCDKTFSTNGHARRHSRMHDNIKPFRCSHPSCFAQFSRKDNLQQHAKRHSS